MKKGIILARVSTPEQQRSGLSIEEVQIPNMQKYAEKEGIEVVRLFEFQETGDRKLRKNFDEMVEFVIANPDITDIVSFRVDRLTRNFRDHVKMDDLRLDHDKVLHFVDDQIVIRKKSHGKPIEDWDTKAYLAKQHINRCQTDAYNTLESRLNSGGTYGRAPYGYINVTKEEQQKDPSLIRVMVDPFASGIVKKVFDLYTTGNESYLSIAKKLQAEYPSKFPKLLTIRRRVEHMLKNHYYYGMREYSGKIYPHNFEPIIEKEVFDIANAIIEERARKKDKKKKDSKHGLYRGLINCDECGCTFSPDTNRHVKLGRNVESECYYYCTNSKHFHTKKPPGTSDKKLTDLFGKLFKQMELPQEDLDKLVSTLKESHEGKKRFTKEETEFCRKEIDRYEQMIENAYEDKCKPQSDPSSITQAQYDKMRSKWRGLQEGYEAKLQKIMKADEEYYITASYLLELASRSYELFMGSEPEQKRQLVTLVFQNLRMKDGKLYYDWVKPFDSIFVSAKNHKWGSLWREIRSAFMSYYLELSI